jgi:hypothetical protein
MVDINFNMDLDLSPESAPKFQTPEILEEEENLPALPDFDTQPVAALLLKYDQEVSLMVQRSRVITVIKDQATNEQATSMALQAKRLGKDLEALRKHYVEPHNKFLRTVNNFFKRYSDPLTEIEKTLGRKVGAFRQLLENERRKQEAEARKAAQELEAKLAAEAQEAEAQGIEYQPVTVAAQVIQEVAKVTRTEEGSASQRRKFTCTILEADQVPREYCEPSQKLLNEAVKAGVREIAGCDIKEEFITGFRC